MYRFGCSISTNSRFAVPDYSFIIYCLLFSFYHYIFYNEIDLRYFSAILRPSVDIPCFGWLKFKKVCTQKKTKQLDHVIVIRIWFSFRRSDRASTKAIMQCVRVCTCGCACMVYAVCSMRSIVSHLLKLRNH